LDTHPVDARDNPLRYNNLDERLASFSFTAVFSFPSGPSRTITQMLKGYVRLAHPPFFEEGWTGTNSEVCLFCTVNKRTKQS
jgi:hypothetical protein